MNPFCRFRLLHTESLPSSAQGRLAVITCPAPLGPPLSNEVQMAVRLSVTHFRLHHTQWSRTPPPPSVRMVLGRLCMRISVVDWCMSERGSG